MINSGGRGVLISVTNASSGSPARTGFKLLLTEEGGLFGTVGGGNLEQRAINEAKEALRKGHSRAVKYDLAEIGMKCGGEVSLFMDYISAKTPFVLFGGGHVAQSLAPILEILDYEVTVFDNRPEIIEKHAKIEGRKAFLGDYKDISPMAEVLKQGKACFIASHGHLFDQMVLKQVLALGIDFFYLGLIGSRNKVKETIKAVEAEGLSIPGSFYSPVGIALGGDTASEIAVAVSAEILAVKYNKPVPHMRERLKETTL